MIKNIAIVGGTHGNEFTGIYLIKKLEAELAIDNLDITYLLANPKAYQAVKRYIDRDLNRSFKQSDLNNPELTGYENLRAKEINQQLGPKGNAKTDFIIDLHTSTAPMGINLVITKADPFHLKLADYVKSRLEGVTITWEEIEDHHFLMSVAERNILVEIGATPQGVLRQDVFDKTQQTVLEILEFINSYNQDSLPESSKELEVYKYFSVAYLPQNEKGEITGMIHQNIQDRDFQTLRKGEPIFKLFTGEEIVYQGDECTISFINEAAYYDEKKAFSMSKKELLKL
ncbi:aspartoacylase [Kangiella sp. HZ709]|uniref:aspartoacylase n=1 Tax=Kangiella sp. HZ709 TaxID=2666328 RepID=UPI0012B0C50E|nr:aspartoacylase [Kangiella sp. HZ709]MRX28096.1 aspartoacylase [Kangiella sp. HZ709]